MKVIYQGNNQHLHSDELINRLLHPQSHIAVDIETISLTNKTIIGFGIAISPADAYYIPVLPERSELVEVVYSLLTKRDLTKYFHNGNFDIIGLQSFAKDNNLPEPDYWNIGDTNIMANVSGLPPDLHTLGIQLIHRYDLFTIQELLEKARETTGRKDVTMLDVPLDMVARKCCNDVQTTFALIEVLDSQLNQQTRECYQVDLELTSYLKDTEKKGFALDQKFLQDKYEDLVTSAGIYEDWASDELGFSISSPAQVGMWLANNRIVLPLTKSGKQLDTSEEVLEKVKHPVAAEVLKYRGIRKQLSTYIEPNLGRDRVYTHFRLDLSTGRLASFDDNLQNIPPELRSMYDPDSGIFTWGDMSQAEMRMFAHFSKDPVMAKAYRDGISIHEVTFKGIYPNLQYSKDIHEYTMAKCLTPEHKILRSDLKWIPLSDIKAGDSIISFDEDKRISQRKGNKGKSVTRYLKHSKVVSAFPTKKEVFKVILSDGSTLKITDDHPFLTHKGEQTKSTEWYWATLKDNPKWMVKIFEPWETNETRDAGWLAGFFDGEGTISQTNYNGLYQLMAVQNQGPTASEALLKIIQQGYSPHMRLRKQDNGTVITIGGGYREKFKFLGSIRPERLIRNIQKRELLGSVMGESIKIIRVEPLGLQDVISLETDSHTYIAEGFAVHNSFNFAMIFNADDGTLASRFKVPFQLARKTKQDWLSLYSVGHQWMLETLDTEGDYVTGIDGRRMRLPSEFERGKKHRDTCKISYIIQGSVASTNKRALLRMLKRDNPDFRLQVHDEFVIDGEYEFPKELDEIFPGVVIPFETKRGLKWS